MAKLALLVGGLLLAAAAGWSWADRSPGESSVEVGFARDMQAHHAQAVEMAMMVREESEDPQLRALAYDIVTTQENQRGQMRGWLERWDRSQSATTTPMNWMDGHGQRHGHSNGNAGRDGAVMPGMATKDQMSTLDAADGQDAEVMFLKLMLVHHRAGVDMARHASESATDDDVVALAKAMVNGQRSEIKVMTAMLNDRQPSTGAAPRSQLDSAVPKA